MADQTNQTTHSGGNSGLAFVVGALVVLVGGLIWWIATGQSESGDVSISIEGAGEAAKAIEGAVTTE